MVAALLLAAWVWRPFHVGAVTAAPASAGVVTAQTQLRPALKNSGLNERADTRDRKKTGLAGLPRLRSFPSTQISSLRGDITQ
ncbi:hypothetical protein B1812_13940 [Methylocystis bryophila]|uniref:Uncharacterized protein n=1 Tax=Methylocystis bryophila TaxID=655015 RepID=A0A1W6MWN8_9HYPH|nr:hypothetical protein B1812_13940 [Methylocystis bryophila]